MKRIDVVKRRDGWVAEGPGRAVILRAPTKEQAVRDTARARADPQPVTVKIHKQDGRIQEERTYPRSADPRRTRG